MSNKIESKPASTTGTSAAEAYLEQELPKARKTLKRTRFVCLLLIVCVALYMGIISTVMGSFFKPEAAAEVASGMLIQHAQNSAPALAAEIEKQVPGFIRQMPDYLIKELPGFRQQLQEHLEHECQAYCDVLATDFGKHIDAFITDHPDHIKTLLENANDREMIRKTLPNLELMVTEFAAKDVDGKKLKKHIDDLGASLKVLETRMDRLANGSNLTPEEKKARRALARLTTLNRPTH